MDKDLSQMVSEIHKALVGDEYRKDGLINKVESHEKKLNRHDIYIWMITGGFGVVAFLLKFGDKILSVIK